MMARVSAVVFLGLFLGMAASSVDGQPPQPRLDLVLAGLAVVGATPEWHGEQVGQGTIAVTVTNAGTIPATYRFDLLWQSGNQSTALNGDAASSFDIATAPLAAGASVTKNFTWRLQPSAQGAGFVVATVRAADGAPDNSPNDNVRSLAVFVPLHRLAVELEGPDVLLEPGATGFHRLRIDNAGNVAEAVAITPRIDRGDSRLHLLIEPLNLTVPAGQSARSTFYVTFAPDGDFAPLESFITLLAKPGSGPALSARTSTIRDAPATGNLTGFNFTLEVAQNGVRHVPAAGQADITMRIRNTGVRADNFTFVVLPAANWTATMVPARVALFAGEETNVILRVKAPTSGSPGSGGAFDIQARGSLAPQTRTTTAQALIGGPAAQLRELAAAGAPYVGEKLQVSFIAANVGDANMMASSARLAWNNDWQNSFVIATPPLGPGAFVKIETEVPAPDVGGPTVLAARWPSTGGAAQLDLSTFVHSPNLTITAPVAASGGPGESVAYRFNAGTQNASAFRISNFGNSAEFVTVTASVQRGSVLLEENSTLLLDKGATRTIAVVQTLPRPAGALRAAELRVEVAVAGHPARAQATVSTVIADVTPPSLTVQSVPDQWPVHVILPLAATVSDDGQLAQVWATIVLPSGENKTVEMLSTSGADWSASLVLREGGNATLRFFARDLIGNLAASRNYTMAAVSLPAPAIFWEATSGTARPRDGIVTLRWPNVEIVSLNVTASNATTSFTVPVIMGAGRATINLSGVEPGLLYLEAQAVTPDGAHLVASLQLNAMDSAVVPEVVEAVDEGGSPARGTPSVTGALLVLFVGLAARRRRA